MDTKNQFSKMTVTLHWLIAIAIIGMLAFGLYIEEMPRSPEKGELMGLHKSIGALILVIALYRLVYRVINKMPEPVSPVEPWQEKATLAAHGLLILGTLYMPISGIMMSVGGGRGLEVFGVQAIASGDKIEWMGDIGHVVHGFGSTLLIIVILLHVAAALKHQIIDKDDTMKRMWGKRVD